MLILFIPSALQNTNNQEIYTEHYFVSCVMWLWNILTSGEVNLKNTRLGLLDCEDEGTTIVQNVTQW